MLLSISRITKWERQKNVAKLIEALQTEDDDLRQSICLILGKIHSADALLALRYIAKEDQNEFVKLTAIRSIENMIDKVDFTTQIYRTKVNHINLSTIPMFD